MNQILATNNNEKNKKENLREEIEEDPIYNTEDTYDFNSLGSYSENNYSNKEKKPMNVKKIIIIFAILIAIFGIALVAIFMSSANKNKKQENVIIEKPVITIEEDGNNALITITTEGSLSKVTYYWDKNDIKELNVSGNKYEQSINIPNGKNTLYVKAQDSTGLLTETTKEFRRDFDEKEPIIEIESQGNGLIKITATDETSMDYITYRWEDEEEETKVKVENEGDTSIETVVDASRGKYKIYITAVDTSGNIATDSPSVQGALSPTIEVKRNGRKLKVKISHDKGFKKIEIYFNGEIDTYDEESEDYDEEQTLYEKTYLLKEGENEIAILATSLELNEQDQEYTQKSYHGTTTYEPDEE